MTSYRTGKPNFKMARMTIKVTVNDPHFQHQLRVSHYACFVQIWWFQLKSVTSYRADKVKFTDRQTDGQTQAKTIPLRPEWPRGKNGTFCTNTLYCIKIQQLTADNRHKILEWIIYCKLLMFWPIRKSHRTRNWNLIHRVGRTSGMHWCMSGRFAEG